MDVIRVHYAIVIIMFLILIVMIFGTNNVIFKFTAWLGAHAYYLKLRNPLSHGKWEQILVVTKCQTFGPI